MTSARRPSPVAGAGAAFAAAIARPRLLWMRGARRPAAARRRQLGYSTLVLDREGRLLRPYATDEGRWRLRAGVADVDPRFLEDAHCLRGQALPFASWRGSARTCACGLASRHQSSHRLGRLDLDHAGGAAARAASGANARRQAPADGACHPARACVRQGRDPRALSQPRALMAAISKACAPPRWPISARNRSGFALAEAALLVALPQSPEARRPDRRPSGAARCARSCARPDR